MISSDAEPSHRAGHVPIPVCADHQIRVRMLLCCYWTALEVEGAVPSSPLQFCGSPSTCWWDDDEGVTHEIVQGEGGEQGKFLMPALYALGQHKGLAVSDCRQSAYWLFTTTYTSYVAPLRVADVHVALQQALHSLQQLGRLTLLSSSRTHRQLLERIPAIPDLQGAWLVLLFLGFSGKLFAQSGSSRVRGGFRV